MISFRDIIAAFESRFNCNFEKHGTSIIVEFEDNIDADWFYHIDVYPGIDIETSIVPFSP